MRRLAPGLLVITFIAANPLVAQAQPGVSTVTIVHGLPRFTADIYVNGDLVLSGFKPREVTDPIELAAGDYEVAIRDAGAPKSSEPALAAELAVPGGKDLSIVAHLDESATPTVSVFENEVSRVPAGKALVLLRHQAAAPPIEVRSDGQALFSVASGEQAERTLSAETHELAVAMVDGGDPLVEPTTLELDEGVAYFVYLIGSSDEQTLDLMVQAVAGIQTGPSGVQTGNAGLVAEPGFPGWAVAVMVIAALGLVVSSRRLFRTESRPGRGR